jgi:hypothetical protein
MTQRTPPFPPRRTVSVALALGTVATACGTTTWLEEKKLGPVTFTRRVLPIMVFKSDYVRSVDQEGLADAVAEALSAELERYNLKSTVVPLAGESRTPRIELAFWTMNLGGGGAGSAEGTSITVDCAYVSPSDQVAFVGRIRGRAAVPQGGLATGVEAIARAIVEELVEA